jgi:outer membrane protein TolC
LSIVTELNIKKYDEGLAKSLGLDKPDAMIGLQYAFPVPNRTAKHKIVKTDLQAEQLRKQKEEIAITLNSALTNLHIQINELENVMKLNQEQIESAKERTAEELKLYNQGRGDLTFVILSQDNEENAKLTYAANALTYHKLNLEYDALMDQLY